MNKSEQRERLYEFINYLGYSARKFQDSIEVSVSYVHNITGRIHPAILERIERVYPQLNTTWLLTGIGEMINEGYEGSKESVNPYTPKKETPTAKKKIDTNHYIPMLPISAQGGKLTDFVGSVTVKDCEFLVSPVEDAELAITVTGDSMYPEYPSGSKVILKKINHESFIDWGRTFVLSTCNGTVIKNLYPGTTTDTVKCVSVNREYPDFEINKSDIYGVYIVLMVLSLK